MSVLIIGAGANIGKSVAAKFAAGGYKVATASRSNMDIGSKHFTFDAAAPATVPDLFAKVSAEQGTPDVVVYNAASRTAASAEDPLDVELGAFANDLNVNTTSVFVAAREAVKGFDKLGGSGGTFIFTGNILNVLDIPGMLVFGTGKAATARIIRDASKSYSKKGYKFYYADERAPDGSAVGLDRGGEPHADLYWELAQDDKQRPWMQTFVKGKGYVDFEEK